MAQFFDVIVVGAGPAGSMAAIKLARAGLKVALLERGAQPGSKNMFGGLLHNTPVLNETLPDFWQRAPVERHVFKKTLAFLTPTSATSLTFETQNFKTAPYNSFTVMRPRFDSWLADEAVKEGALLLCNCAAENVIRENKRVVGVSVKGREGELRSNVVIAADGVLSFMAERAALRPDLQARNLGLGVKLLLSMNRETINERFNLARDEGADFTLVGATDGLRGGAFMYTNSESVSVGLVMHLDSLRASGRTPYDILNNVLRHPHISKLVKGAVPLEYSAHLIPEGGIRAVPRLYTDGMLVAGDAAGLCYTNGINLEGMNLAMTSGALAAETAIEATKAKDFSAERLSTYRKKLERSFVFKDMRSFKNTTDMMRIERLFRTYPELVSDIMDKIYRSDGIPRAKIMKLIRREISGKVKTRTLLSDALKIKRGLL